MPFAPKDKAPEKWKVGNHANCITWSAAPRFTMPRGGIFTHSKHFSLNISFKMNIFSTKNGVKGKTRSTEIHVVEDKSKNSKFKLGGGGRTTFIDKYVINAMEVPGPGKLIFLHMKNNKTC